MTREDPRASGRPVEDWTGAELAVEMEKRKIVNSISVSRVNELLRLVDLQSHRRKCCPAVPLQGTRTVCVDEMTSLQPSELRAKALRSIPGKVGRCECQYTRHGTLSLTGSREWLQKNICLQGATSTNRSTETTKS